MSRVIYTKETALSKITEIGTRLVSQTKTGYWSAEDNARMIPVSEKNLDVMRCVYRAVRSDAENVLAVIGSAIREIGGIDGNFLRLVAIDLYGHDFYA